MKVLYKILYKNGTEDEIVQELSKKQMVEVNSLIYQTFQEGLEGVLTFGDGTNEGYYVRVDDITRVSIKVIQENEHE